MTDDLSETDKSLSAAPCALIGPVLPGTLLAILNRLAQGGLTASTWPATIPEEGEPVPGERNDGVPDVIVICGDGDNGFLPGADEAHVLSLLDHPMLRLFDDMLSAREHSVILRKRDLMRDVFDSIALVASFTKSARTDVPQDDLPKIGHQPADIKLRTAQARPPAPQRRRDRYMRY
jgi:hypothetical protein